MVVAATEVLVTLVRAPAKADPWARPAARLAANARRCAANTPATSNPPSAVGAAAAVGAGSGGGSGSEADGKGTRVAADESGIDPGAAGVEVATTTGIAAAAVRVGAAVKVGAAAAAALDDVGAWGGQPGHAPVAVATKRGVTTVVGFQSTAYICARIS